MTTLEHWLDRIDSTIWTFVGVPVLIVVAVGFTVATRGIQFRRIRQMFRSVVEPADETGGSGDGVSAFKSFSISAASRVGTGNIAGVAVAIGTGGPGAVFWMWVMGLLVGAMSTVESTLAQIYKQRGDDGFRGGPAYYMREGLRRPAMAAAFAVIISLVYGLVFNAIQASAIVDAMKTSLPDSDNTILSAMVGLVLVILVTPVIFGGVKAVANISSTVVPFSAAVYVIVSIVVLGTHAGELPGILGTIVHDAFRPRPVAGATLGFGIVLMTGVQRGLFSNESGMGSVPNAAAAAAVTHPVKQGLVQTLGVYFDTLFMCTVTAFVVLSSDWRGFMADAANTRGPGAMTQNAITESFSAIDPALGGVALHLVTACIFLFAGTSLIGNYYYGETNINYVFGSRLLLNGFRVLVLGFILFGATVPATVVWSLGNTAMPFMALLNIAAIVLLAPVALAAVRDYDRQLAAGLDPRFTRDTIPGLDAVPTMTWPRRRESGTRAGSTG